MKRIQRRRTEKEKPNVQSIIGQPHDIAGKCWRYLIKAPMGTKRVEMRLKKERNKKDVVERVRERRQKEWEAYI